MAEEDPPNPPDNEPQGNKEAEYVAAITEQIGAPLKDLAVEFAAFKRDLSGELAAFQDQIKAEREEEKQERNAREQRRLVCC